MNGDTVSTEERRGQGAGTLADRLNLLFDRIKRDDGEPYTNAQVGKALGGLCGKSVDRGYISGLRTGAKVNPTKQILQGLADFFDVSPAYFFDDERARDITEQIELATALRNAETRALALTLLRVTEKTDLPLVAELVRTVGDRPELREALKLMLTLDDGDLRMAGDVLRSVLTRRKPGSTP